MNEEEFTFTEQHLTLLRNMVVNWSLTEVGAPTIEPSVPYGTLNMYGDINQLLNINDSELSAEQKKEIEELHQQTESAMGLFLSEATLSPGLYEYEDRLHMAPLSFGTVDIRKEDDEDDQLFSDNRFIRFFQVLRTAIGAVREGRREAIEREKLMSGTKPFPVAQFEFTDEHLKLLHRAAVIWEEPEVPIFVGTSDSQVSKLTELYEEDVESSFPVPAIDPKRPYGDMTYHFLDMVDALAIEPDGEELLNPEDPDDKRRDFSENQIDRLDRLHYEMQEALQVFLRHAQIENV